MGDTRGCRFNRKKGNELCLMHCVLNYPTPNENANISMIKDISKNFPNAITGYSDHTLPESMDTCLICLVIRC